MFRRGTVRDIGIYPAHVYLFRGVSTGLALNMFTEILYQIYSIHFRTMLSVTVFKNGKGDSGAGKWWDGAGVQLVLGKSC